MVRPRNGGEWVEMTHFKRLGQPLIPTQKVRSTGQLVEKILGRSTEKSYHVSGGKLEVFGLKHI